MGWSVLSLTLELMGDLHCGDLPLGFVASTFPYVPCHIPVFAMVPAAVRLFGMPDVYSSYAQVERLLLECVRCTPLYVLPEEASNAGSSTLDEGTPLFPWEEDSLQELQYTYLSSNYGIALNSVARSARDGCLYETEVLLARGRNCHRATRLSGALFVKAGQADGMEMSDDGTLSFNGQTISLATLLNTMQLGGDRSRSLGRPAKATLATFTGKLWNICNVTPSDHYPILGIPGGQGSPVPVICPAGVELSGTRAILTGRRHRGKGFGEAMDAAQIVFSPGWKSKSNISVSLVHVRCAEVVA